MPPIPLYVSAAGVVTAIALGFALCIHVVGRDYDRPYLHSWRAAWLWLAAHATLSAWALMTVITRTMPTLRPALSVLALIAAWAHLYYMHEGMWSFCQPDRVLPRARRWLPALAIAAAVALVFAPIDPMVRYELRLTMLSATWGVAYVATGMLLLRNPATLSALGSRMLTGALLAYGVARLLEPLALEVGRAPMLEQLLIFGGIPLLVAVGAGMLITLLEDERVSALRHAGERAQAVQAARESEAALAAALASSSDAVCILDREQRVVAFNAPFAAFVSDARGVQVHEGMSLHDVPPPARREYWASMFARAFEGRPLALRETVMTHGGRPPRVISARLTPVRRDGAISGVLIVGRDVTEEEGLRAEIERREQRFRSLIENASDMVFMLSREGVIEYASPSVTRVLGHDTAALRGQDAFSLVHPEDVPALRDATEKSFAGDPSVPKVVPFRARLANGDYARLEAVSRPFAEADGTPRLIVSARDVRERFRLESELLAARRLETVGRLAGGVAHDFNNLLTAILGNVALMRSAVADQPDLRGDLEEIADAAQRGAELTRRLLTFARRQLIEPRTLDLGTHVRGLERLLHRLLGEDVRLVIEAAAAPWPVKADPTALEQALVNLVVNARDAMPAGGTLSIRTSNVRLDDGPDSLGVPAGDWVRIDVADTGIGIDEGTLGQIFEPFFTTKGKLGGSGLGLSTVYGIVSQVGGHVRVRSTPGAGTTFSLFFPRAAGSVEVAATTAAPPDGEPAGPTARHETVLLIEDEESVRNVTARLLKGLGYDVLTAVDGADGIDVAERFAGTIHAIVSDLVMPRVGGAEAVARIRERRPETRVVFISGFSEDALSWRGAMPQGGRMLMKPFSRSDLDQALREGR